MKNKLLKNPTALPIIAIILTAFLWGLAGPVIKLGLEYIDVYTFLFFRFLIVGVLMLPIMFFQLKKEPIHKGDLPNLIILAFVAQVSILIIFLALKYTTVMDVAIISVIAPILTIGAGHYFFNEKVTKLEEVGIIIATLGTLFIIISPVLEMANGIANGHSQQVGERVLGNIFALLFQISWPAYIIMGKRMMGQKSKRLTQAFKSLHMKNFNRKYSPLTITGFSFYVALGVFTIVALVKYAVDPSPIIFNNTVVISITYMAIFGSIVAYWLYQWALKFIDAGEAAVISYLGAVFTILAAFLILGETPTNEMLVGALIIAIGISIAERYKN